LFDVRLQVFNFGVFKLVWIKNDSVADIANYRDKVLAVLWMLTFCRLSGDLFLWGVARDLEGWLIVFLGVWDCFF